MKVSKAQAQANRAHIVETASAQFRAHGYDGVGVADLMAAAGFTHGGFYKHFGSKVDLMAEAAAHGMASTLQTSRNQPRAAFFRRYLSRAHRDNPAAGCTLAALGTDAARQPPAVRERFAAGLDEMLAAFAEQARVEGHAPLPAAQARARLIAQFAQALGALVMSRACPDDAPLADEILQACRSALAEQMPPPVAARQTPAAPRRARTTTRPSKPK